jgi:hypothetical protein
MLWTPLADAVHSKEELVRLLQLTDKSTLAAMREKGMQLVMQAKEPRAILRNLYSD